MRPREIASLAALWASVPFVVVAAVLLDLWDGITDLYIHPGGQ